MFNIHCMITITTTFRDTHFVVGDSRDSINNGTSTFSPTIDCAGSRLQEMCFWYQTKASDCPSSGHISSYEFTKRTCDRPSYSGLGWYRGVRSMGPPEFHQHPDSSCAHSPRRPALHQRPVMLIHRAYSQYNPTALARSPQLDRPT